MGIVWINAPAYNVHLQTVYTHADEDTHTYIHTHTLHTHGDEYAHTCNFRKILVECNHGFSSVFFSFTENRLLSKIVEPDYGFSSLYSPADSLHFLR